MNRLHGMITNNNDKSLHPITGSIYYIKEGEIHFVQKKLNFCSSYPFIELHYEEKGFQITYSLRNVLLSELNERIRSMALIRKGVTVYSWLKGMWVNYYLTKYVESLSKGEFDKIKWNTYDKNPFNYYAIGGPI